MLRRMIRESLSASGADRIATRAYVFGSCARSKAPNDIDVLLVYCPSSTSDYLVATAFRHALFCYCVSVFGVPAHVTLLTVTEEAEARFAVQESAVLVWPDG